MDEWLRDEKRLSQQSRTETGRDAWPAPADQRTGLLLPAEIVMSLIFVRRISQDRASIRRPACSIWRCVASENFSPFHGNPKRLLTFFWIQQFDLNICRWPRTFRRLTLLSFKSSQRARRHCASKNVPMQEQGFGLTAGPIMHWEAVGLRLSFAACRRSPWAPQIQERELVVRKIWGRK